MITQILKRDGTTEDFMPYKIEDAIKKVTEDSSYKVGDIIDNATRVTAIQLVEFLDQFTSLNSIDEVKTLAEKYINEIQKEIKLCQ